MSNHGSARAVLAGAAIVALAGCILAGCGGVPNGTRPDVPGPGGSTAPTAGGSSAANATSQVSGQAPLSTRPPAPAKGFALAKLRYSPYLAECSGLPGMIADHARTPDCGGPGAARVGHRRAGVTAEHKQGDGKGADCW